MPTLSLRLSLLALVAGCGSTGLFAQVKPEATDVVDGFPFSQPSLAARASALNRLADVKRVVPVSIAVRTSARNPWIHPSVGFELDDRVLAVFERVLAEHGIALVARSEVLDNPQFRASGREHLIAERLEESLGLLGEAPGLAGGHLKRTGTASDALVQFVLGAQAAAPASGAFEQQTSFDQALDKEKKAGPTAEAPAPGAVPDPSAIDDPAARAKAMRDAKIALDRAPPRSPAERIQRTLMYAPASIQKSPQRRAVLAQRPAAWIESEPEDGFIAQLLGSTRADAALLVDLCVGFDPTRNAVGLCGSSSVVVYAAGGRPAAIPMLVVREQPAPTADEVYFDPPAAPELVGAGEGALAKGDLEAMRGAAQNWRVAFRTAYDAFRAHKSEGEDAARQGWSDQQRLVLATAWRPSTEALAAVDAVVEKLVRSILRQMGRTPRP